jgi:hypothetical protein
MREDEPLEIRHTARDTIGGKRTSTNQFEITIKNEWQTKIVSNRINLRLNSNERDIVISRIAGVILFSIEAFPIVPN